MVFLLLCCACGGSAPEPRAPFEPSAETSPAPAKEEKKRTPTPSQPPSTQLTETPPEAEAGLEPPVRTEPEPAPIPEGTKVLHVGDSFAGALGLPLSALLEEKGVRSVLKHTDSSYLTDWAWDGELQKYVWRYNPDLIVVTLGANELGIAQPERREKTVRKIISVIGERPCLWVAIPLWKGRQNGLMDVIERSVSPCIFMDTNELLDVDAMPRISDGIHPTTQARKEWAAFVLDWLRTHRDPTPEQPWRLTQ